MRNKKLHTARAGNKPTVPMRHRPIVMALALLTAGPALAFQIETDNPDIATRLDFGLRYNLGIRGQNPDPHLALPANDGVSFGNLSSKRGDVILNRLDVVPEFDFVYKGSTGFRISAAAWADPTTYDDNVKLGPTQTAAFCNKYFVNCEFPNYTKRYYSGPSGQIMDAFVFTSFDMGDSSRASVRLGRHNLYWGSGLFSSAIAVGQGAVDGMKGQMSPGTELKELYMPLKQASASMQFGQNWSGAVYRTFEWRHNQMPEAGTFFAPSSSGYYGPNGTSVHGAEVANQPPKNGGDWGLMGKFNSGAELSTALYYREFFEKAPYSAYVTGDSKPGVGYNPIKNNLWGLGVEANVLTANWGWELARRENATLRHKSVGPGAGNNDPADPMNLTRINYPGPRGTIWTSVLNMVKLLPETPLWTGGSVSAELTYERLDKLTHDTTHTLYISPTFSIPIANSGFVPIGSASCVNNLTPNVPASGGLIDSCASKDAWNLAVNFAPSWPQVLPGVDLTGTVFASYGLKGNSPTGGMSEGNLSYALALEAELYAKHKFKIAYSGTRAKLAATATGGLYGSGSWPFDDRAMLAFTYKTSF